MTEQTQTQARTAASATAVEGLPAWQLARRERIVQAALHALEEQDYERIQIRDVAAAAGVALGTLYRYFSSKEHLYAAVLQEWAAFGRARASRPPSDPVERVRRRVHAVIRALQKQPQFFKVHVLLQASGDANARELLRTFERTAQESLAGEFDMLEPDEAQDASIMLWSIINSMVTQAVFHGEAMKDVHRVADRFLDLLEPRMSLH
jgi:TetR/AcrR family transcriptional regulator, cholesterol catabolism regulator